MQSHSDADSTPLSAEQAAGIDAYWRAANYLSVGQLYLRDNPLLRQPLEMAHVKALVVGHWGTVPGLNLIYMHLNRAILKYDLDMIHVCGPGHGGAAVVAQVYLEGTSSSRAAAGRRSWWKATTRPTCTSNWPPRWTAPSSRSCRSRTMHAATA